MTPARAVLGLLSGLAAGVLSGAFGVGGGIVAQPAIRLLLRVPEEIVAVATPLPMIFPTALMGALTYRRAGQVDLRAAAWIVPLGAAGSAAGAAATAVVEPGVLLVITAALLAWQAGRLLLGLQVRQAAARDVPGWQYALVGGGAGFLSGLLGIGGGIIMVPLLAGVLGMPLKRALGTSLVAIVALVAPGTVVHTLLGHVDWGIFLALTLGAVPGARLGARLALAARDRTLRIVVGGFLSLVALFYGTRELLLLLS